MRLPWPFNRPQRSNATDATQVYAAAPRGPQAWRDLPVLATSVGKPPLVAPTPPFREDLAGAAAPPIALAPLTHGRGLDAPAGLVGNVARAASVDYNPLSAPLAARRRHGEAEAQPQESLATVVPEPSEPSAPSTPIAATGALNVQRAPVVARPAPVAASLVSAAGQALPLPPTGRIGNAQPSGRPQAAPVTAAAQAPMQAGSAAPAAAPVEAQTRPPAERLTLGQARRLGLGAPIDPVAFRQAQAQTTPELVLTAPVAKSAPTAATAPAATTAPSVEPVPTVSEAQPTAPAASAVASQPAITKDVPPTRTLASATSTRAATPSPQRMSSPATSVATRAVAASVNVARPVAARRLVQRAPRAEPAIEMAALPIVGARPIVPAIQLAAKSARPGTPADGAPSTTTEAAALSGGGEVRIHRGAEASDLAGTLDARAFTSGGDIYLPQSHGPLSGPKAQSLLAHELTHVAQQRKFGSSLPAEESAHGQELESQAVAAERGGQLPLATPADKSQDSTAQDSSAKESSVSLNWALAPAPATAPAASSVSAAQRAPEAKWSDPDDAFRAQLDSNEAYMFEKFERRLRRLLISERERGGTLIDAL